MRSRTNRLSVVCAAFGAIVLARALAIGCGSVVSGGSDAAVDSAAAADGVSPADGSSAEASVDASVDARRDAIADVRIGDAPVCGLPPNECADNRSLRVRSNPRTEDGSCVFDETVVSCTDLGGVDCINGQCTVIVR